MNEFFDAKDHFQRRSGAVVRRISEHHLDVFFRETLDNPLLSFERSDATEKFVKFAVSRERGPGHELGGKGAEH